MNEHRVPMLGALRRHPDPARSNDPRVRELVSALAGLDLARAPRADFRAELRAQLVAVAPRLIEEGETGVLAAAPAGERTPARAPKPARERGFRFAKPLIAAACVLTAFIVLLGGAVLLSQHALPGDALYGIKRASENTEYNLAGSNVDKGKLKLEFAANRIGEVADMVPNSGTPLNADAASLVRQTLASARSDIQTGSKLLTTSAIRGGSTAPLTAIQAWTTGQIAAVTALRDKLPAGPLRTLATQTLTLLQQAAARATTLSGELGRSCLSATPTDYLGPQPCAAVGPRIGTPARGKSSTPNTTTRPPTATTSTAPPVSRSTVPDVGSGASGSGASSGTNPASTAVAPPVTGHQGSTSRPPLSTPTAPAVSGLPSVPGLNQGGATGSAPKAPISVDSCGVSASVGPLGIVIGGC